MAVQNEYAKALFLLSEEDGNSDAMLSDVKLTSRILSENPDYVRLLDTPAVSKSEKLVLIDEAFSSLIPNLKNLLKILSEKHITFSFSEIAKSFEELYNESRGIEYVEAVTAVAMSAKQTEKMKEKLAKMTGKTIIIKNTVDKSILGGVKLRYSGIQLDGSVKTRLDTFEKSLKNTVI
jgi:ATP synthase F1 delta subunit